MSFLGYFYLKANYPNQNITIKYNTLLYVLMAIFVLLIYFTENNEHMLEQTSTTLTKSAKLINSYLSYYDPISGITQYITVTEPIKKGAIGSYKIGLSPTINSDTVIFNTDEDDRCFGTSKNLSNTGMYVLWTNNFGNELILMNFSPDTKFQSTQFGYARYSNGVIGITRPFGLVYLTMENGNLSFNMNMRNDPSTFITDIRKAAVFTPISVSQ